MKRILSTILLCVTSLCAVAQEDVTLFFLNDGTFKGFYDEEIDSIAYSHFDLDSVWHSDAVVQDVWLADSVVRIPIEKIDSICHKVPEPVYKSNVIRIDDSYSDYITSVDGLNITFSPSLPENMRPHIGDVIVYEGTSDLFPEGFVGKVTAEGNEVVCEPADIPDIYDKFVFFGRYVIVNKNGEGDSECSIRRVHRRSSDATPQRSTKDDEDYGIDNWRMGDGETGDIELDPIKKAFKFEIKKFHSAIKIETKITPVISIEYAYDLYALNPMLFYKRVLTLNYENKYLGVVSFSYDPKEGLFKDTIIWNEKLSKPDWKEIDLNDYLPDENDDDNCQSFYLFNKEIPIPDFPLLKVGFGVGFFWEPKIEADLSIGAVTKGSVQKTFIYRLDKDHWGRLSDDWKDYLLPWRSSNMKYLELGEKSYFDGPKSSETEFFFEGSGKLSLWAGIIGSFSISCGVNKNLEVKEEAKLRIGPYCEGEIKANFADGWADRSNYTLLKDSKVKAGVKIGLDLDFSAKVKWTKMGIDVGTNWNQLSWTPKELLWERKTYFLPEFEAPEYSIRGNSLNCSSKVSRFTLPNSIGFALFDENGKEIARKYQKDKYKNYEADNPYIMYETFDNLDFVNHRYTISPTTRLFGIKGLGLDMPDKYQTTVLCPDSRHPHLIDLGLSSGTKWLCSNLYADAPDEAGGYYQWGKPYMVHAYTDLTYRAPNFTMANYQSSEYDAATANLGQEYCTPTMSQFIELHDNCRMDYKYSSWGNNVLGVFLKGKNGNNLYLPFSGFKSGVKVNNNSEGWFLSSDAVDSNNNLLRKAIVLKNDDVIWKSNDAMAYGHSVRPVSASSDGLVIEPQQLDYEVYVGQKVGQSVTITNNGSVPVTVTVAQTAAPFQVDEASLGTFTVKPKELHSVLVYFSPTEEIEYTSVLTLSYGKDNACVVSKVPLKGKGINAGTITPGTAIDLGLPSGTLWASCNLGATNPEDYGNYYAWGETEEKDYYYWDNYMCEDAECGTTKDPIYIWNGNKLYADIAGSKFDVATSKWGPSWQMPSSTQMDELLNECIWTWCDGDKTKYNGTNIKGYIISSKVNNNKIFLPAAGNYYKDELLYENESCLYWSSSQFDGSAFEGENYYSNSNSAIGMDYNNKATYTDLRYYGQTIRPVMNVQKTPVQTETITIPGTNINFKMVAVEGGKFWMGLDDNEPGVTWAEKPRHQVELSDFAIGETEVTAELYEAVTNKYSYLTSGKHPAQVNAGDALEFIAMLNALTGRNFRLPTEAEWEYAATGGKYSNGYKYAGSDDINEVAWYAGNSREEYDYILRPVAQKKPNELGLYDMSGNLQEWCKDYYPYDYSSITSTVNPCNLRSTWEWEKDLRITRGGSRSNRDVDCIVKKRNFDWIGNIYGNGFRLVLTNETIPSNYPCPDSQHPHMIDLGLPSGTKWACCNVGATKPEEYGGYYAWGETEEKDDYSWDSYFHYDSTTKEPRDLGPSICGTEYDAAHKIWGEGWQMPSNEQVEELFEYCTHDVFCLNGIIGKIFLGPNYNIVFIPFAGRYSGTKNESSYYNNNTGSYWSGTPDSNNREACELYIYSDGGPSTWYRNCGLSIRPIVNSNADASMDYGVGSLNHF